MIDVITEGLKLFGCCMMIFCAVTGGAAILNWLLFEWKCRNINKGENDE